MMSLWPDNPIATRLGIALPIIQAPMAGSADAELAIAAARAGALGSIACAMLNAEQIREQTARFRAGAAGRPLNLNFFCHQTPEEDPARLAHWRRLLRPYFEELGVTQEPAAGASRRPFDTEICALVEDLRPEVVSFHFGLPAPKLLSRVKKTGAKVLSSATSVEEALFLEERGCDVIIAQGSEAGGHQGTFLGSNPADPIGTIALVPQVVDAVKVPVIAAGGIADGRGLAAVLALGASAAQIGTAYLRCPEVKTSPLHRAALTKPGMSRTALTNLFTGRQARGIVNRLMRELGPISESAPAFPLATPELAPLRSAAEQADSSDFSPLWAGQAYRIGRDLPAEDLTSKIAADAVRVIERLRS